MKRGVDNEIGDEFAFGTRLRRLREAAGLSQEELASRAGLSAKAISSLERGARKRPYPHTMRSLADAMELAEDERASLLEAVQGRRGAPATVSRPSFPMPLTPLVGREKDLEEVTSFLTRPEVRLLTLTGTGGVGKTRLALESARASLAAGLFPDGVAFVALAPLEDPTLVVPNIARSLGVRETGGLDEVLRARLRNKRMLLVLDNFEHVLDAVSGVADLMESCPDATMLATSRAPLRVRGEQEYPVGPLALPSSTRSPRAEGVVGSASGRLFAERAKAASPSFEVTPENASSVAAICWRLGGLPLALELAAARAQFMDPATLLSRLDRALATGWARDVPERQRTMRATLDWSLDLLSEAERALFRRLSVFAGGFTLEAAEEVGATEVVHTDEVLDLLWRLVEQSLVTVRPGGARYGMLEPVREYGWELLEESGEAQRARERHAGYYLALAEEADPELKGPRQMAWLERLEAEHDNLRAALAWLLREESRIEAAARLAYALRLFWWSHGHQLEGRRWSDEVLTKGGNLPTALRAKVLTAKSSMAYGMGNPEELRRLCEESAILFRRMGDDLNRAVALTGAGAAMFLQGDLEGATASLGGALEIYRRTGHGWGISHVLAHLALVPLARGDHDKATRDFEEASALAKEAGAWLAEYVSLYGLAQIARIRGDHERAVELYAEGLKLAIEARDRANAAYCLEGIAGVVGARGEPEHAARLFGVSEALLEAVGTPLYAHVQSRSLYRQTVDAIRSQLDETVFAAEWAEGRTMGLEEAVAFALGEATHGDTPPG